MFKLFSAARAKLLLLFLLVPISVSAQIPDYPYPNFVPGAVIASGEVNANFGHISDFALNRAGGTIEGHITIDPDVTLDGVDISDYFDQGKVKALTLGTVGSPAFASSGQTNTGVYLPLAGEIAFSLSGTQKLDLFDGLIVAGNQIFNTSGQIPAISTSYFVSVAAQDLQIFEPSFADGNIIDRLADDETITGAYTFTGESGVSETWDDSGTVFNGLLLNVTNTASDSDSVLLKAGANFTVSPSGKLTTPQLQVTQNAGDGYFLVGDSQGKGNWSISAASSPVPAGMLAFYETACPTGWTDRSSVYANKFVRGGPSYDPVGGGSDSHGHTVDPPLAVTGIETTQHTHTVDVPATDSTTEGDHDHSVTGQTGDAGGSHQHTDTTGAPSATAAAEDGPDVDAASSIHTHTLTTNSVDLTHHHSAGSLNIVAIGDFHHHSTDFPATATGVENTTHTHTLDIASFASGGASNVPRYVQVVICRKN